MGFEQVTFESRSYSREPIPKVTLGAKGCFTLNKFFVKEYRILHGKYAHFFYDHKHELLQIKFLSTQTKYSKMVKIGTKGDVVMGLVSLFDSLKITMPEKGTRMLVIKSGSDVKPAEGIVFRCAKKWFANRDTPAAESVDLTEEIVEPQKKVAKKKIIRRKTAKKKQLIR